MWSALDDPERSFGIADSGRSTYSANALVRCHPCSTSIEVDRPMKFDIQGKEGIAAPTPAQISRAIKSLRSYGPSSYASLTDDAGNYVQVAGGGISCMVEHIEIDGERRRRAFHDKPSPVRPDGTILVFGAGNIPMRSDEWFMSDQVVEIFLAFLNGRPFPPSIHWRPAPGF